MRNLCITAVEPILVWLEYGSSYAVRIFQTFQKGRWGYGGGGETDDDDDDRESYPGRDMIYDMRTRKPKPTLLLTHGIINSPHHLGMDALQWIPRGTRLSQSITKYTRFLFPPLLYFYENDAVDDAIRYTQGEHHFLETYNAYQW